MLRNRFHSDKAILLVSNRRGDDAVLRRGRWASDEHVEFSRPELLVDSQSELKRM
jgi:hypothetical protein